MPEKKQKHKASILRTIKNLKKATGTKLRSLINSVDSSVIRVLAEVALNIHKRSLGIANLVKKGLQKFNDLLHKFGCSYKKQKKSDIEQNRNILLNHPLSKGSGLGLFLRYLIKASSRIISLIVRNSFIISKKIAKQ